VLAANAAKPDREQLTLTRIFEEVAAMTAVTMPCAVSRLQAPLAGDRECRQKKTRVRRTGRGFEPQALPVHPWSRLHGDRRCCSAGAQIVC
jgi:hypothetical protein